jgi:hypothetical protein
MTPCAPLCLFVGGGEGFMGAPSAPDGLDDDGTAHFWTVVRDLYDYFGMANPW